MSNPAAIDREVHEARRTVRQFWNYANLCYCGGPGEVLEQLLWALNAYGEPGEWREEGRPDLANPAHMLLAYMLDGWDLTEHGTSLYGAWLTRDGVRLRDALRQVDLESALDPDWAENERVLHPKPRVRPDELLEGAWESVNL